MVIRAAPRSWNKGFGIKDMLPFPGVTTSSGSVCGPGGVIN
jgi:hypothetical protein